MIGETDHKKMLRAFQATSYTKNRYKPVLDVFEPDTSIPADMKLVDRYSRNRLDWIDVEIGNSSNISCEDPLALTVPDMKESCHYERCCGDHDSCFSNTTTHYGLHISHRECHG